MSEARLCEIFSATVALGFPLLQRSAGVKFAFAPSILVPLLALRSG